MIRLLPLFQKNLQALPKKIAVITDTIVEEYYGKEIIALMQKCGKEPFLFSFPSGEKYKTRETKEHLENALLNKGLSRDCAIVSLGGGVVTDMAGFLASTFCRGVPLVHIPTTLMAMVDAAVGGKTGVNTEFGKNLIGSFYPAQSTIIDSVFLSTLSQKELKNGIIEMLKHGLITDKDFFEFLENNVEAILHLQPESTLYALKTAIAIKQAIVEKDPQELGERRILNFGHTIGHALEKMTAYTMNHGEAVTIGVLGESYLSHILGFLRSDDFEKIVKTIEKFHFQLQFNFSMTVADLLAAMSLDKKGIQGNPRFVLLEGIGKVKAFDGEFCQAVDEKTLKQALDWSLHVMHSH